MAATLHAPILVDPILAAIGTHACAWAVFQMTEAGTASDAAEDELHDALTALIATPCTTREGAQALRRHLRWYVTEEAANGSPDDCLWLFVNARLADLTLLMRDDPTIGEAPSMAPLSAVVGRVIHRMTQAGELLACLALIGGGMAATGFASPLG
jgi:hypothetical protein